MRIVRSLGIALCAVAAATVLRFAFAPLIGSTAPLLLHTVAVAVVAQYEGALAGFIATFLGAVCVDYWFIEPARSLIVQRPEDYFSLGLFLLVNTALTWFGGQRNRLLTGYKASVDELQKARQRLRFEHEVARIGTFEWYAPENRNVWSPELERLYGLEPGAFGGTREDWNKLIYPDDAGVISQIDRAIAERRPFLDFEFRIVCNGEIRWLHGRALFTYSQDGRLETMMGVNIDITGQKRAEESVRVAYEELQASFEVSPVPIIIVDTHNQVVYRNRTHRETFNNNPAEANYDRASAGYRVLTADGTIVEHHELPSTRIFRGETVRDEIYTIENLKTGERRLYSLSGLPIYDAHNHVIRIIESFHDVTTLMKTEEELRRSNEELQAFAYTVSHDLAEPLRQIDSFSNLLMKRLNANPEPDTRTFLEYIAQGTAKMSAMMDGLLQYSRVGSSDKPKESVDCNAVLDSVLQSLSLQIRHSEAAIERSELPVVIAWPGRLDQVLQNLIQNAIKYRKPGVPPVIRVAARDTGSEWVFAVSDNGIGFEPKHSHNIFTLFKQLHPRGEYEGMGMGLAIVKRIVERHGGQVCAESTPGVGSSFYFTVPKECAD